MHPAAAAIAILSITSAAAAQNDPAPQVPPANEQPAAASPSEAAAPATSAPAAEQAPPGEQSTLSFKQRTWIVQAEPVVWFVSPSGEIHMPSSSAPAGGDTDSVRIERLNLDSPLVSPAGSLHFRADRWRFAFSGATYNAERNFAADSDFLLGDVSVTRGDDIDVDFDFFTAEASVGYRVYRRDFQACSERTGDCFEFLLDITAFGGARVYDLGFSLENSALSGPASSTSTDQFFAEPIVGALAELEIAHDFSISLQLSGGAMPLEDHSSGSLDIALGFRWRPHPNVGVLIGWRQVAYWLSDGGGDDAEDWEEFEYSGRLAGVFGGVTIRF